VVEGIQQPEVVEVCDVLEIAVDVHNAGGKPGECSVEWWITDESGISIISDIAPVPLLDPCDRTKVALPPLHVGTDLPPAPVLFVYAMACCDTEPFVCEMALVEPGCVLYETTPDAYMLLLSSIGGGAADEPLPSPSIAEWEICYGPKQTGSVYRALTIDSTTWDFYPYCAANSSGPPLNYVTINVVWQSGAGDGSGTLYVEGPGIDVDLDGETDESGTAWTIGDGSEDPAGSALVSLPLQADVYSSTTQGDPTNPATWGGLVMSLPLDFEFTTAVSTNHVTDNYEVATPGVALDCNTVSSGPGVPFAETGGSLPYVGTDATMVCTMGIVDAMALGVFELDVQVMLEWPITPGTPGVP
jgi:hypothetical protein